MANWLYDQWAKIGIWTPREAMMLSLGVDPDDPMEEINNTGCDIVPEMTLLERRINAAIDLGKMKTTKDKIIPSDYLAWASSEKLQLPEDLVSAIKSSPEPSNAESKLARETLSQRLITTREANSYLKIIKGFLKLRDSSLDLAKGDTKKKLRHLSRELIEQDIGIVDEETTIRHLERALLQK